MASKINEKFFFDHVRAKLFEGTLKTKQSEGLAAVLAEWGAKHAGKDDRWLAYAFATAHHETGRTMQPIKEWGGNAYFFKMYDKKGQRPDVAARLGNTEDGDGVKFCGRGYVQLTGRANYKKWQDRLGIPLTTNPDLALQADKAVKILFEGMEIGAFTGKKLADYIKGSTADWVNARRIINRLDKAELIKSYALEYYAAISYTT